VIGRLRGTLVIKKPPYLLIEVGGVGYEVQAPMSTIYQLPALGSEVTLSTHFHVREDLQVLYGFYQDQERALFRALIKISGVGPKMALGILSGMNVAEFIYCVDQKAIETLVRLPGIGRKTAERLIIEMAGKLAPHLHDEDMSRSLFSASSEANRLSSAVEEAIAALITLGYKPMDATKTIQAMTITPDIQSETLIRRALQQLAR
jgi:Holliday junction DNA helicase RuvA